MGASGEPWTGDSRPSNLPGFLRTGKGVKPLSLFATAFSPPKSGIGEKPNGEGAFAGALLAFGSGTTAVSQDQSRFILRHDPRGNQSSDYVPAACPGLTKALVPLSNSLVTYATTIRTFAGGAAEGRARLNSPAADTRKTATGCFLRALEKAESPSRGNSSEIVVYHSSVTSISSDRMLRASIRTVSASTHFRPALIRRSFHPTPSCTP